MRRRKIRAAGKTKILTRPGFALSGARRPLPVVTSDIALIII
jgi:hypothetical protein